MLQPAAVFAVAWDDWSACIIGRSWGGMVYVEAGRKRYFLTNHQIVFTKKARPEPWAVQHFP